MNLDQQQGGGEELGVIIGTSSPYQVYVSSKQPLSIGKFVILKQDHERERRILGVVQSSFTSSLSLNQDKCRNFFESQETKECSEGRIRDQGYSGIVTIKGYVDDLKEGRRIYPSTPVLPGTFVYDALPDDLMPIFAASGEQWIEIGTLPDNELVPVKINITDCIASNIGIFGQRGSGKSNTNSLLIKNAADSFGTVVVFDYHGDYLSMIDTSGNDNIRVIPAEINPRYLNIEELEFALEFKDSATKQDTILYTAFDEDTKGYTHELFWQSLITKSEAYGATHKGYEKEAFTVVNKIKKARRKYHNVLKPTDYSPLDRLKVGKINIVDLTELTFRQADLAVSFYLDRLLDERKRLVRDKQKTAKEFFKEEGYPFPDSVLVIIEESHVFIPKGDHTHTKTKGIAGDLAREGRKFGLGMVITSQRPRGIDPMILSQIGTSIVLRIEQPDDQAQVSAASEALTQDLINLLPSLSTGTAIISGQGVKIPTFVKIYENKDRKAGGNLDAAREWADRKKKVKQAVLYKERSDAYVPSGYIGE